MSKAMDDIEDVEKKEKHWWSIFMSRYLRSDEVLKNYGHWVPPSEEEAL